MTCEGGKPNADSKPPGYSDPKVISPGAKSLLKAVVGEGAKLRLKATSGYSDPKAISPGAKSSLKAKRPSSNSKPPGYSDPKVVSLGAKSSLKAECAERRLKATRGYSNPKVVSLGAKSLLKAGRGVEAVPEGPAKGLRPGQANDQAKWRAGPETDLQVSLTCISISRPASPLLLHQPPQWGQA